MLGNTQHRPTESATVAHPGKGVSGSFMHRCWDSQTHPDCRVSWSSCPYIGDNYQTQLIPVQKALDLPFPSHYQRFSIFTFSFVDPTAEKQALRGPVGCSLPWPSPGLWTSPTYNCFHVLWLCSQGSPLMLAVGTRSNPCYQSHEWHLSVGLQFLSAIVISTFGPYQFSNNFLNLFLGRQSRFRDT